MLCVVGTELLQQYESAARNRETGREILLISSVRRFPVEDAPFDDLMMVAKQKYSEAFVAWVLHREACEECRAIYGRNDQVEFASV